jgi:hypothetical protein
LFEELNPTPPIGFGGGNIFFCSSRETKRYELPTIILLS